MAIGVDNTSNGTIANAVLTVAHICTGTETNGILIVTVQVTDTVLGDRTISGVTHNGEVCTHLPCDGDDGVEARTEIWYRINPTTGGAPNIVVTAGGKCTDLSLGAISLTGVNTDDVIALVDSYSFANGSDASILQSYGNFALSQSFTATVSIGDKIGNAIFFIRKWGSPTGYVYAKIYTHSGTYGESSVPNVLLAPSDAIDVSIISENVIPIIFHFSGAQQVTLTNGTYYCIVVEIDGGDATNYIRVTNDSTSPTHSGNLAFYSGSWTYSVSRDLCFYVTTIGAIENAVGDSTPPTLDITTVGTSSYVVDSLSSREADGTKIATSTTNGQVISHQDVGADIHCATYVDAEGAGAQTMSYSDTDSDTGWTMSAVAIMEAVVGDHYFGISIVIGKGSTSSVGTKASRGISSAIANGLTLTIFSKSTGDTSSITGIGSTVTVGQIGLEEHEGTSIVTSIGSILSVGKKQARAPPVITSIGSTISTGIKNGVVLSIVTDIGSIDLTGQKDIPTASDISSIGSVITNVETVRSRISSVIGIGSILSIGVVVEGVVVDSIITGLGSTDIEGDKQAAITSVVIGTGSADSTGAKQVKGIGLISSIGQIITTGIKEEISEGRFGTSFVVGSGSVTSAGYKSVEGISIISGIGVVLSIGEIIVIRYVFKASARDITITIDRIRTFKTIGKKVLVGVNRDLIFKARKR